MLSTNERNGQISSVQECVAGFSPVRLLFCVDYLVNSPSADPVSSKAAELCVKLWMYVCVGLDLYHLKAT